MISFWTFGTCAIGISMPRSPRATMMPSEMATMASRSCTASGFSILATMPARPPTARMRPARSSTSAAVRTNESAT